MTTQTFQTLVRLAMRSYPSWRLGQATANIASLRFPASTEPLQGTEVDCFDDDRKIPAFLAALVAAGALEAEP